MTDEGLALMRRALFEPWTLAADHEIRCKPAAVIYNHSQTSADREVVVRRLTAATERPDAAAFLRLTGHDLKRLREALDVLRAELLL